MKQPFGFSSVIVGLTLVLGLSWAPSAHAALVTYEFSGTVTDVASSLHTPGGSGHNGFDVGLHLFGRYTFDTTTAGSGPPPLPNSTTPIPSTTFAMYPGFARSSNIAVGDLVTEFRPGMVSLATVSLQSWANYNVEIEQAGRLVNGFAPSVFLLELRDETGTAFGSIALPGRQAPNLNAFDSRRWTLMVNNAATVAGSLDTLQAVPLPSTWLLFLSALAAMSGWSMRSPRPCGSWNG